MIHVYVNLENFEKYLEGKMFMAYTKELKKRGDIHISINPEMIIRYTPTEDGVVFLIGGDEIYEE